MSSPIHPLPPIPSSPPSSGGVRRHHTISASSRTARAAAKDIISEETQEQAHWNDDEVVDQDWVGGVGAVGEKTSLHRQSSLPTRYHRGFQGSKSGNLTPKSVNSLAAIAGHEGDEEPWNLGEYAVQDDEQPPEQVQHQQTTEAQSQSSNSPLSPHVNNPPIPSPPPAASSVRRHVSLTYGAAVSGLRKIGQSGLKRSGTLQATGPAPSQTSSPPDPTEHAEEDEYAYDAEDLNAYGEEYYLRQQNEYGNSPIGRSPPWAQGNDWRTSGSSNFQSNQAGNDNGAIDDVQRALSALELASNHNTVQMPQSYGNYQQTGQNIHPPRFNPSHPLAPGPRAGGNGNGGAGNGNKLQLVTDFDGRTTPLSQAGRGGLANASGYNHQQLQGQQHHQIQQRDERAQMVGGWEKDRAIGGRLSNSNLQYGYQQQGGHGKSGSGSGGVPNVPSIPQQYLSQQQGSQRPGLGVTTSFSNNGAQQTVPSGQTPTQAFVNTPIDVPSLIAAKGYNPANFDTRPQFARYFVIKSYTEDDVHKSLKYEIWSSTDPGNKRLDKAFKETAGRGPIYLFFSVNASGHFCGMAEMLTPVDYTRSSTVWASDKWKGVFKVRWIFVRDIPNLNLRHIKLNNTQERKPVTNSRDTQELLPDAGQEMLRIFHTHPARTSLLQDFAFYELQAMQKMQGTGGASPPSQSNSAIHSPTLQAATVGTTGLQQGAQNTFGMGTNPSALAYQMPQITPMMQMQLQMGMSMGSQFGITQQTQAMHQSVMRHSSPGPQQQQQQSGGQGYGY
ncbi:hypothetical protein K443DRAFT_672643 [Laccaria amethystina LaAM-08-1]|uniref:YTH domain-containing protein n=1 Tax=Laccaria amethystina LaAM-08-1 TaxID=1095629 RepID=A0A0C9X7F7_9AGAR|nr:hypothetical protein K443DRAFT_672643 [Laccaria amethystina LaAM-08-1]